MYRINPRVKTKMYRKRGTNKPITEIQKMES